MRGTPEVLKTQVSTRAQLTLHVSELNNLRGNSGLNNGERHRCGSHADEPGVGGQGFRGRRRGAREEHVAVGAPGTGQRGRHHRDSSCPLPRADHPLGTEVHHTRMDPQVVDAYRKEERARVEQKLDEYVQICTRHKFHSQKVTIVHDGIAKGLEELISLHGITKLVVGAAADERYSDALLSWSVNWSMTACKLCIFAKTSCKIWFTCKGHLICIREGNKKTSPMLPLPSKHKEALREAQHFREKAYEESTKRHKVEKDLLSALQMIGEWTMLHQHEMQQRQAIEELLHRERQEVREMIRRFEAVYDQLDDAKELKRRVKEIESARKDHKEELATSKYLVKTLQADKEKLEQYLKQCLTEIESARKHHEEELTKSTYLVEMLQADKEKLQEELKQCIAEIESDRKDHKEELATSKRLIKALQRDKKKLQHELRRCTTNMESARKDHEEEAMSKYLVEMLQEDKRQLQQELDAALTEAEDLRRKRWLSSASETVDPSPPSYFICPISKDVMCDPHIAADGFTYEGEEIRGWLNSRHNTSPMTNLKLAHSVLTPNRALRSAIIEWQAEQQQQCS
ncbi:unnamed protein product [Urochloa decumbens]|uniref:RING-type E3 ubiquitin transferase n=1 Tax=Urochloa decumbens TaxID=240449 RepID=A0ABC9EG03_9POAL